MSTRQCSGLRAFQGNLQWAMVSEVDKILEKGGGGTRSKNLHAPLPVLFTEFAIDLLMPCFSGYDSRGGSGRRAFGSGYRRDDDYRGGGGGGGGGDRYGDRYDDRRDDRSDKWNGYSRNDDRERREERGLCPKRLINCNLLAL